MSASVGPWDVHGHALAWGILAALGASYLVMAASSVPGGEGASARANRGQVIRFSLAWVALAIAMTWPIDDLAQRWSLTARICQEALLALVVPPLLLSSLPRRSVIKMTSPHVVDTWMRRLTRPVTATVIFNGVILISLLRPSVALQARSAALHGLFNIALLVSGLIMWIPALGILPGAGRLSTAGRSAYLFIQSLLANVPAVIFNVSHRPIYAAYEHKAHPLLPAILDQQLAGVVVKLAAIAILWGTAAAIWWGARRAKNRGQDPNPLRWEDVERELLRVERRPRRRSISGR